MSYKERSSLEEKVDDDSCVYSEEYKDYQLDLLGQVKTEDLLYVINEYGHTIRMDYCNYICPRGNDNLDYHSQYKCKLKDKL